MSQAEELLKNLSETTVDHQHPVTDSDTYYVVDPITRRVDNQSSRKNVIMQRDHNSERFTFECPRYIEGHDMSLCNSTKIHYVNIDAATNEEEVGAYEVDDIGLKPDDENSVICTWLISRNATRLVGPLQFWIQYTCVEDGNTVYEWYTDVNEDIEVKKTRNNVDDIIEDYPDILDQLKNEINSEAGGVSSWNDLTDKPFGEEVITVATLSMDESNENNINDGDYTILYYFGDASNIVEGKNYEMMIDNETIGSFCMHTYGRPFDVTIRYDGGYGMSSAYVSIDNKIWHHGSEIFVPVNGLYMYDIGLTNAFDVVERNITTIESKYIPTGFMSWNDLKDKPFYGGEEILITQGCPVTNGTVINIYDGIPDKCTISIGWDSTSYKFDYEYGSRTSFGNESLNFWMAPDTGEPFYVSIKKDDCKIVFNVKDSEEHYVTINAVSTIMPISEKYIPDTIARKEDITTSGGGASDSCNVLIAKATSGGEGGTVYTCNKTYQELDTAWKNTLPIVAYFREDKPTGSEGTQTTFNSVKFSYDSFKFYSGDNYIEVKSDDTVTYVIMGS